jgi:hypothetical protein
LGFVPFGPLVGEKPEAMFQPMDLTLDAYRHLKADIRALADGPAPDQSGSSKR